MYVYVKSIEYREAREAYFVEYPDAKVEYDEMYQEVVTTGNGKKKKKRDENVGEGMHVCEHMFVNIFVETLSLYRLRRKLF